MPASAQQRCAAFAAKQNGVISRDQAVRAGLSPRAVAHRVRTGVWIRIFPRVYRLAGAPPSWESQLLAALLWAGPTALVSHRAAARLWKLEGFEEAPVEISVQRTRAPADIVAHQLAGRPRARHVDGFPVTPPERTLLDLAAVVSIGRAGRAMDDALIRRITTPARLRSTLDLEGGQGRPGTGPFRRLLELRFPGEERAESHLELRFLRLLRRAGLPLPIPQFEVMSRGRLVARLDFAYPDLKLAIETHGFKFHGGYQDYRRDAARENRLKRMGWIILIYTWDDVVGDAERVTSEIAEALLERVG